jgi:hypothetical protein
MPRDIVPIGTSERGDRVQFLYRGVPVSGRVAHVKKDGTRTVVVTLAEIEENWPGSGEGEDFWIDVKPARRDPIRSRRGGAPMKSRARRRDPERKGAPSKRRARPPWSATEEEARAAWRHASNLLARNQRHGTHAGLLEEARAWEYAASKFEQLGDSWQAQQARAWAYAARSDAKVAPYARFDVTMRSRQRDRARWASRVRTRQRRT